MNFEPHSSKKRFSMPFMNGGTTLLLAVLLVLVLVVLSLLSLSAARSDWEFSQKMAQKNTQYYAACNQAQEILAQVQQQLDCPQPDFTGLHVTADGDEIRWEVPISDQQMLQAALSRSTRQVVRWQAVSSDSWADEDTFSILQP